VNESYFGRILRLTLIAPDITEVILAGRQPSTLQLDDLLKPLPAAWALQRSALFNPQQPEFVEGARTSAKRRKRTGSCCIA
jgi:hypothetical protein